MSARILAWAVCVVASTASAEPEGYRGGEGRPPGTTYAPPDGPSLTVRGVTVERGRSDGGWTCGAVAAPKGREDLVTVTLVVGNPGKRRIPGALASFDLVFDHDGTGVAEGSCVRRQEPDAVADLGPRQRRIVRERFLVPRGATPKVLVYNDDDFPALFALPKPRR